MQEQIRNILCGRLTAQPDSESTDPILMACGHFIKKDFKKVIEIL